MCLLAQFQNSKINVEERNQVLQEFNGLANKEKHDIYLGGLIRVDKVCIITLLFSSILIPTTPKNRSKNVFLSFQIRVNGNEYIVCRQAFCSIHGITRHRANRIGLTLKEKIAAPLDMRG